MINRIPAVKDHVEVQVLNHTFKFRRLKWQDMSNVTEWIEKHKMHESLAIPSFALYEISGRPLTPEEALKVLLSMPRSAIEILYKYYKGSMDPHRMFSSTPIYSAPDAATYMSKIQEEDSESEAQLDEVEAFLTQKFGRKEVQEEMALGRQMAENTKMAGAMTREQEYLTSVQNQLNRDEAW